MTERPPHHGDQLPDPALADALIDEVPPAGSGYWARIDDSLQGIADGGETAGQVVRLTTMNERATRPNPFARIAALAAAVVLVGAVAVFAINAGSGSTTDIGPADGSSSTSASDESSDAPTTLPPTTLAPTTTGETLTTAPVDTTTTTEFDPTAPPVLTSTLIDVFGTGGPFAVDQFNEPTTGPNGSGCTPGPGDLPDGIWFGALRSTSPGTPFTVQFDLMCEYAGENAPVPDFEFDEYVQNDSDAERTVPVADHAALYLGYCYDSSLTASGGVNPPLVAVDVLDEVNADDGRFSAVVEVSVWLHVLDGEIVEILDGWYSCAG